MLKFGISILVITSFFGANAATVFVAGGTDPVSAATSGANLQAAVNSAQPGDIIMAEAGKMFQGPITLNAKNNPNKQYVTIRSSASDAVLPAAGVRVNPARDAANLPKILGGNGFAGIQTTGPASYYRLIALEMLPATPSASVFQVLQLGLGGAPQISLSDVPRYIDVDRCYIHGYPGVDFKSGIQLDSANTTIENSYISDFHVNNGESDAITGFNTPGPISIVNNYLDAAGTNIIFGGAIPGISGVIPSNIVIKHNDFYKQLAYRFSGGPNVKNMIELKFAQDVTIQANSFQNVWVQGTEKQFGQPLVLNPQSENGQVPWATVQRINIIDNVSLDVGGAIGIGASSAGQTGPSTNHISLVNNLFQIRADNGFDPNFLHAITFGDIAGLRIDHVTYFATPYWQFASVPDSQHLTSNYSFADSITSGAFSSDCGYQFNAWTCSFIPPFRVTNNLFVGGNSGQVDTPAGSVNYFPATTDNIGFAGPIDPLNKTGNVTVDYHNYGLSPTSPYKGKGLYSTDPGFLPALYDQARQAH